MGAGRGGVIAGDPSLPSLRGPEPCPSGRSLRPGEMPAARQDSAGTAGRKAPRGPASQRRPVFAPGTLESDFAGPGTSGTQCAERSLWCCAACSDSRVLSWRALLPPFLPGPTACGSQRECLWTAPGSESAPTTLRLSFPEHKACCKETTHLFMPTMCQALGLCDSI